MLLMFGGSAQRSKMPLSSGSSPLQVIDPTWQLTHFRQLFSHSGCGASKAAEAPKPAAAAPVAAPAPAAAPAAAPAPAPAAPAAAEDDGLGYIMLLLEDLDLFGDEEEDAEKEALKAQRVADVCFSSSSVIPHPSSPILPIRSRCALPCLLDCSAHVLVRSQESHQSRQGGCPHPEVEHPFGRQALG